MSTGNDFGWALSQMRLGKSVRRRGWRDFECITIVGKNIVDEDGSPTSFRDNSPLLANDWMLA